MGLNAPQGFMLIPTIAASTMTVEEMNGLNAPQGFMLIPTKIYEIRSGQQAGNSLNAPQGFMLIPTVA